MPELLVWIEDELGPEAVWRLTENHGGTSIFIPRKVGRSHLLETLGEPLLAWLIDKLGTGHLNIPAGPSAAPSKRLSYVRAAIAQNKTSPQIAQELGCDARTVQRAAKRLREVGFI